MAMRSWLFVPGDSERKLAKAPDLGADVVIVDLEDAVAPQAKIYARQTAGSWLEERAGTSQRWVRINSIDSGIWRNDLAAVMPAAPAGIMIPKAAGPEQLRTVAAELYELEQLHGIPTGSTRILPLVSETPAAALGIPAYATTEVPRLAGLTWGAEDLSAAIGASRKRDGEGHWTDAFRMVRAMVLLAAHAREVLAIDTLHADFRDAEGLRRVAEASREDGFDGMLAIHPSQVEIINQAFTPTEDELDHARAIVAIFAANPNAGALQLDGKMIDQPHLAQARRLLDRAR